MSRQLIVLKQIWKKKLVSFLIIIQFTITIVTIVQSLLNLKALEYPEKQLNFLNINIGNIYKVDFLNSNYSEDFAKSFNKFDIYLKENLGVKYIGAFDKTNTKFEKLSDDVNFQNKRKFLTKGTFKEKYPDGIEIFNLDYNIYNLLDIKITSGRGLIESDFNKDTPEIPILISEVYSDIVKIGDTYKNLGDKKMYTIVGLFESKLKWLNESNYISNLLEPLNDKIISPFASSSDLLSDSLLKSQNYLISADNENFNIKTIEDVALSNNLSIKITSIEKMLHLYKANIKDFINSSIAISLFTIIFACITMSIILYYSINERKKEFTIRLMFGAKLSYIKSLIILEIIYYIGISSIISCYLIYRFVQSNIYNSIEFYSVPVVDSMPFELISIVILIIILLSLLTSLIPINKLKFLNPIYNIKGRK